jgi:hypothetical protein
MDAGISAPDAEPCPNRLMAKNRLSLNPGVPAGEPVPQAGTMYRKGRAAPCKTALDEAAQAWGWR